MTTETKQQTMTAQEIADRLVELCGRGEYETAQRELFADDALSLEPEDSPGFARETKGLKAIIEKGHKFQEMVEKVHGVSVSEPIVAGKSIAFKLIMDATMKGRGRSEMSEICLYKVKDGKVVSEQFVM